MKLIFGALLIGIFAVADGRCTRGCDVALASYFVWPGASLPIISNMTQVSIPRILSFNAKITNQHYLLGGTRVNVPFPCDCLGGGKYLGHVFTFNSTPGVTYNSIAEPYYANLTTAERLKNYNAYLAANVSETGVKLKVPVLCSCGDVNVSSDYGLFITYPVRDGETLASIAAMNNLSAELVRRPEWKFSPSKVQKKDYQVEPQLE